MSSYIALSGIASLVACGMPKWGMVDEHLRRLIGRVRLHNLMHHDVIAGTEDMGGMEAARAIEPLCILWCIPGFLRNQWTHAFKLLK